MLYALSALDCLLATFFVLQVNKLYTIIIFTALRKESACNSPCYIYFGLIIFRHNREDHRKSAKRVWEQLEIRQKTTEAALGTGCGNKAYEKHSRLQTAENVMWVTMTPGLQS